MVLSIIDTGIDVRRFNNLGTFAADVDTFAVDVEIVAIVDVSGVDVSICC